jgi:hypothetical protein
MVATGISEFTFGFAFLFEQASHYWGDLRAAPILPNLYQEGNLGWDAHLPRNGTDFYYQFKLTDLLQRHNAKLIRNGTYRGPYFRLPLHRFENNRQHARLKSHADAHPHTYYVAPEFSGKSEFNAFFLERQIVSRSRLIPLEQCDEIDDGNQHYITFQYGIPGFHQCSEPTSHGPSEFGRNLERLYRGSAGDWMPIDISFAERLFETTVKSIKSIGRQVEGEKGDDRSVSRLLDYRPERSGMVDYLKRTSDLLAIYLGLTLVLVGESSGK